MLSLKVCINFVNILQYEHTHTYTHKRIDVKIIGSRKWMCDVIEILTRIPFRIRTFVFVLDLVGEDEDIPCFTL